MCFEYMERINDERLTKLDETRRRDKHRERDELRECKSLLTRGDRVLGRIKERTENRIGTPVRR